MDQLAYAGAAINAARDLKETIVRRDGPGAELLPMLGLWHDGQCLGYLVLTVDRPKVLEAFRTAVPRTGADMIQHVHESYFGHWPDDDGPSKDAPIGTLEALFKAGDPHVREVVWCMTATAEKAITAALAYEYGPNRTVRWLDEPEAEPKEATDLGGAYAGALAEAFEDPNRSSEPLAAVGLDLGISVFTWYPVPPARNEPCPCGSGLKAKRCCWA
jgi:hypothetical protein